VSLIVVPFSFASFSFGQSKENEDKTKNLKKIENPVHFEA